MPLMNPQIALSESGIEVDVQGFVTFPNDADAVPFKVKKSDVNTYVISVMDGTEREIYTAVMPEE